MTRFWSELLPNEPADRKFSVHAYQGLQRNKMKLNVAHESVKPGFVSTQALLMAMAMVETTTLSGEDRDRSKDGGPSENVSMFNLSVDLVRELGYHGPPQFLNDEFRLSEVVTLVNVGLRKWGCPAFLDFVRGGRTAFQDHVSYDAAGYRNTVATILRLFDARPELMWNDQRVEIDLRHV
jgi:hypothetical protein